MGALHIWSFFPLDLRPLLQPCYSRSSVRPRSIWAWFSSLYLLEWEALEIHLALLNPDVSGDKNIPDLEKIGPPWLIHVWLSECRSQQTEERRCRLLNEVFQYKAVQNESLPEAILTIFHLSKKYFSSKRVKSHWGIVLGFTQINTSLKFEKKKKEH